MTTAIDRAKALLAALPVPLCGCCHISCKLCQKVAAITCLGFTPATLAVAAQGFEALYVAHDFCCDFEDAHPCTTENCQVQRALAEWEGLLPETQRASNGGEEER